VKTGGVEQVFGGPLWKECANKIWGCIKLLIYSFPEFPDFGLIW